MSKAMTILGMVVAGLLAVVFTLDWAIGVPFETANWKMNLGVILGSLMLGFASWEAFREVR
ncbi:hypothetical protein [Adhaeretor mobilis]|uniref:Uncharacterized protein n=1 Tax=Adhaeretor mobilis TaxID=1930276 RepID=A0A517N099_9BACT|nr:hypothetical protein [Adhaeretor mobilis]QDT00559.1 hypothetical protein HG15A2_38970 [Adhaeretor mobilis]